MKRLRYIMLLAGLMSLSLQTIYAQRITRSFRNTSMSEALTILAKSTKDYRINFMYDELEDFTVTTSIVKRTAPDAIRQIMGFYPMKMTIDGENIFVECTQKTPTKMIGRIIDNKKRPVDFANVALLNVRDSSLINGGVTNENGQFVIPCEARKAIVRVSCVGYITASNTYNIGKIGTITLKEATMNLQKIVVKGHRQPFRMTSEGLVAQVEGTSLEKMGSAEDVLKHLPRVMQKNGDIEVLGKGKPLIYIDNKKIKGTIDLDRLSSSDIKHVEVITEPGAEYDATYQAVIRIKTTRKKGEGLGLTYRQVYQRNHQDNHREVLDLNYRYRGLDIFSNLYGGLSQGYQDQHNDNRLYGKTLMNINEDLIIKNKSYYTSGSLGFNYVFNDRHSVGATYEVNINPYSRGGWNSLMDVWKNGSKTESYTNDMYCRFKSRPTQDITAYYAGQIGKVSIEWNGEIYLRKTGQTQYSEETGMEGGDSRTIESDFTADSWMHASKLVLSFPVWKGTLKIGNEFTESCRANLYTIDEQGTDLPGKTDDQVEESNLAAFVSYGLRLNKVELNAGLRYEHVSSNYYNTGGDYWSEENKDYFVPNQSRKYDHFFPNVSLTFPVGNVKMNMVYKVTVSRPSYSQLSSNVQYNSRYYYQGGNPLLKPTFEHGIGINLGYKWFQFFANWRYLVDPCYQVIEPYHDNELISMYTFRNLNHTQVCYVGLTASPTIGWWHPTLDAGIRKQFLTIGGKAYSKPIFIGSFNNAFSLPCGWTLNLDMSCNTQGHSALPLYMAQGGVDVSLRRSFLHDRLNVILAGNDLFATMRNSTRLVYGTSDIYTRKYTDTRMFMCSFSYKFNVSRSKYKGTGAGNTEKNRL